VALPYEIACDLVAGTTKLSQTHYAEEVLRTFASVFCHHKVRYLQATLNETITYTRRSRCVNLNVGLDEYRLGWRHRSSDIRPSHTGYILMMNKVQFPGKVANEIMFLFRHQGLNLSQPARRPRKRYIYARHSVILYTSNPQKLIYLMTTWHASPLEIIIDLLIGFPINSIISLMTTWHASP